MRNAKQLLPFLLLALVIALNVSLYYRSENTRALNNALASDELLADFPYSFRVLNLDDGVAKLSTPRSSEVPVERIIGILYPELTNFTPASPAYMKAQKDLAVHQAHAKERVLQDPAVNEVIWELDKAWLMQHNIQQQ